MTEEKTAGGILVPNSFKGLSNRGVIVEVGQNSKLKRGMVAYRVKDWGEEIIVDGEKHFLMEDKAILATE